MCILFLCYLSISSLRQGSLFLRCSMTGDSSSTAIRCEPARPIDWVGAGASDGLLGGAGLSDDTGVPGLVGGKVVR